MNPTDRPTDGVESLQRQDAANRPAVQPKLSSNTSSSLRPHPPLSASSLPSRDKAVLDVLGRTRLATAKQLERLLMTSGSPATRRRRMSTSLSRLNFRGYVRRLGRRVGGERAGSAGHVYELASRGHTWLATYLGTGKPRRAGAEPGSRFVAHVLAVTELFVSLSEQTRTSIGIDLVEFLAEPMAWRTYPGQAGRRLQLRPDASIILANSAYEFRYLVEVDLATEALTTIRRKCDAYITYYKSGTEQHRTGGFPKIVWLCPDRRRESNIRSVIEHLPKPYQPLFEVSLLETAPTALTINIAKGGES
jgi:hypothetical protein